MSEINIQSNICSGTVILAGGDSKRLGRPKALLDFDGTSMIELIIKILDPLFAEIIVVTDHPELYSDLPVRLVGDLFTGCEKSPLRGIHAGLRASKLPYQFVVACDMPFLNRSLIRYMAGFTADYDAIVPKIDSYFQPLHSFYKRSCAGAIEKQIKLGKCKVTDFYADLHIKFIGREDIERFDPHQESFININTFTDYQKALLNYRRNNEERKIINGGE
ncbi:MAG: molybdenum cofactor guanylyltransferase [Bacillota bacterium]|nr:molybdenum cofactor guanylyltransferase [Bacillota bacterium]